MRNAPFNELQNQTDAETAALWAIEALREGRYNLGAALARIAAQAAIVEARPAVMVPLVGVTRPEYPRDENGRAEDDRQEAAAIAAELERRHAAAVTELFPQPVDAPADPVPQGTHTARCAAVDLSDGNGPWDCHEAIYWQPGRVGTGTELPIAARWQHLNPATDQHHQAVPNR